MIAWTETTEADYWEMLCVLPPERRRNGWFLVGEPADLDPITGESGSVHTGERIAHLSAVNAL
jgi:hypothetical protein